MKKLRKIDKILFFFGIGKWEYTGSSFLPQDGDIRTSKIDGRKQVFVDEGAVSGMANFDYWEDIEKKLINKNYLIN